LILSLEDMNAKGVEKILCLGDLMNAGIAKILAAQAIPTYLIWGNNDGEKVDIVKASYREDSNLDVSLNTYDFLEIEDRLIFITHYNDLAAPMAKSGLYDAIFYGHNHLQKKEVVNDTLVVNPGELCAQKTGLSTYAIYNTETNDAEIITLENSISLKSDLVSKYLRDNEDSLQFRSKDSFQ
ncbi:YfcE family phosphodiesterase, partial [Saprospiraceae bacterium]|nr:YfcE family phosphodiesterase [Saprospiraceae bacterium]